MLRSLRPPRRITTINELLHLAPWVTGVKTGHTFDAGYVLVGSGRRKGVELISVVIGAPTDEARDEESLELLEYGFSQYRRRVPIRAGQDLADPSIRYAGGELPLRAARTRRRRRLSRPAARASTSRRPREVEGPIERGAVARPGHGPRRRPPGRLDRAARRRARSPRRASSTGCAASSRNTRFSPRSALFVILIGAALLWRARQAPEGRGRSGRQMAGVAASDPHSHPQRRDRPHRRGAELPSRPPPPRGREPHRRRRQGDQRRPRPQPARPAGDRHRLRRRPDRHPACSNSCARSRCSPTSPGSPARPGSTWR